MKKVILLVFLSLLFINAEAVPDWKLKKETSTLKIFTATINNSDYKAVKVECTVTGNFSQVIAALFDIDRQQEWVYSDKHSKLLKKVSNSELIYYSEVSVPWPATNRDFISHLTVTQPSINIVNIESHAEANFIPEKDGIVRIKNSTSHWTISSLGNNQLRIDYTIQFEPGGSVPVWLTNMFITKGPFETFDKLQERVKMPAYRNASFDFIKNCNSFVSTQ